jgi:hypothetical protein
MNGQRAAASATRITVPIVSGLLVLASGGLPACSDSPFPGEQEEVKAEVEEVPAEVKAAAVGIGHRVGGARCEAWYWDREDEVWECTFDGLSRRAELDIAPDGTFSELELVYGLAEVEQALPDIAEWIRTQCRDDPGVYIELSIRREQHLDDIPELAEAWTLSGFVLEIQCPNGRDFEVDSKGMGITKKVDDPRDPSADEPPTP